MGAVVARWKEMGRSWRWIEGEEGSTLPRGSKRRAESTVTPAFRPVARYRPGGLAVSNGFRLPCSGSLINEAVTAEESR
jgi:hypothetical protein